MDDGRFQWDDSKAVQNSTSHGITFEAARGVFKDRFAIEQIDDRDDYGEERFTVTGMTDGRLLFVVYTMRGETIRLISARAAEPFEQRIYHEQET